MSDDAKRFDGGTLDVAASKGPSLRSRPIRHAFMDESSDDLPPLQAIRRTALPHVCEWTTDHENMTPLLLGHGDGICVDVDQCKGCGQQRITTVAGARKILAVVIVGTGGQVAGAHVDWKAPGFPPESPYGPVDCGDCPTQKTCHDAGRCLSE